VSAAANDLVVGMGEEEYRSMPGLSNSSMKDLAVSPLRYWHLHLNPNRPAEETTPFLEFGHALHCAVLEPDKLDSRYCQFLDKADYPGCLDTMDDLKEWLRDHGLPTTAKRKQELIDRVGSADSSVPIWEVMEADHELANEGKLAFSKADWQRISDAADSLRSEPRLMNILESDGQAEVAMFATDPATGVRLKARMDFVAPRVTLDLKTFTQQRGRSIDKSVASAIYYEGYYRQAYFYSLIRSLQSGDKAKSGAQTAPEFVMAFVESDPPHEVRLRSLLPRTAGEVNLFWEKARLEVRGLIDLYADCVQRFGEKPWRTPRDIDPLEDQEMPGLIY
jgi:hypothetical protein